MTFPPNWLDQLNPYTPYSMADVNRTKAKGREFTREHKCVRPWLSPG